MQNKPGPIPENEAERVFHLAEFDIDYSNVENDFKGLALLAAKIAGTDISLINLIDSFTQWTIASHGLEIDHVPREESICQYTLTIKDHFEIADLSADERFNQKIYVDGPLNLRYYMGVPITTPEGFNIGSLCVIDKEQRTLSKDKLDLLKVVADEIVSRLKIIKTVDVLRNKLVELKETQKKVSHDIRGPIAGIVGLADMIVQQGDENNIKEIMESIAMINNSGRSVLELADEILSEDKDQTVITDVFNLVIFKDKLEQLYLPQAKNKGINFLVKTSGKTEQISFSKNKLLQIAGNLIYNAIKFTPEEGTIEVELELTPEATHNLLKIKVIDTGVGMDEITVATIMEGATPSSNGTHGETGFGFGLSLVKRLIETLNGEFSVSSDEGNGATFEILIRQAYQ